LFISKIHTFFYVLLSIRAIRSFKNEKIIFATPKAEEEYYPGSSGSLFVCIGKKKKGDKYLKK
jgi:hypothetical protein